jgi:hypothetical protein
MVLTGYFALSLVTGLFATIACVMRSIIADLTPASGRQDHTTSPSAASSLVRALLTRDDAAASTASHPNVRDDGQRPSSGTGRRGISL